MKTKGVRLYGKKDLRLEEFELPEILDDEILVKVISDSICMSSYKAATLAQDHKRVPKDIGTNPVLIGHETAGIIEKIGKKWQGKYQVGDKFALQPALNYLGRMDSPGYSYRWCGGAATYMILPQEVMLLDCLLPFHGDAFFQASLAEPVSCIVGAFHASYHTTMGSYEHRMGIVEGGTCAILAGAGPMGLGAIDYAMHGGRAPRLLVVTDVDAGRLSRAAQLFPVDKAKAEGIDLRFINTKEMADPVAGLRLLTDGAGFDDVFVFAPVGPVCEQGDAILGKDGCLNFFAGPTDTTFGARINFYNIHYGATHTVGTTGGNTDDMRESLDLSSRGKIRPEVMITHIGGLDSVAQATLTLPDKPAGKKLAYTHISMEMTAIEDFGALGESDARYAALAEICTRHGGLWSAEAEGYLLKNW